VDPRRELCEDLLEARGTPSTTPGLTRINTCWVQALVWHARWARKVGLITETETTANRGRVQATLVGPPANAVRSCLDVRVFVLHGAPSTTARNALNVGRGMRLPWGRECVGRSRLPKTLKEPANQRGVSFEPCVTNDGQTVLLLRQTCRQALRHPVFPGRWCATFQSGIGPWKHGFQIDCRQGPAVCPY